MSSKSNAAEHGEKQDHDNESAKQVESPCSRKEGVSLTEVQGTGDRKEGDGEREPHVSLPLAALKFLSAVCGYGRMCSVLVPLSARQKIDQLT